MRISDWSADVCSSDLRDRGRRVVRFRTRKSGHLEVRRAAGGGYELDLPAWRPSPKPLAKIAAAMGGSPLDTLWHDGGYSVIVYPDEAAIHALSPDFRARSEEHTSELQSLMRISYAVFCLKKK